MFVARNNTMPAMHFYEPISISKNNDPNFQFKRHKNQTKHAHMLNHTLLYFVLPQ